MWTWQRDFETAPPADPGSIPRTPNGIYARQQVHRELVARRSWATQRVSFISVASFEVKV